MLTDLETNPIHIVMPKSHLGILVASYLYQTKTIDEDQKITSMNIPIECDDEGNITITVGVLKETVN